MILCRSHGFGFLRVPKNASTSLGAHFVQNYGDECDRWTRIHQAKVKDHNVQSLTAVYQDPHLLHLQLGQIASYLPAQEVSGVTWYGVVRHPLERQLSLYFSLTKNARGQRSPEDFRRRCRHGYLHEDPLNHHRQREWFTLGGRVCAVPIPYPLISEWLVRDFEKKYGKPTTFPKAYNSGITPVTEPHDPRDRSELVTTYYDRRTKIAVLSYFHEDVELYEDAMKCAPLMWT